ncbi:MAG: ImuA family protein [Geminicoccaceae bacterium]
MSSSAHKLAQLRRRLAAIEGHGVQLDAAPAMRFGLDEIDRNLPGGGLAPRAVHEIEGNAATGFAASLLAAMGQLPGSFVWCQQTGIEADQGRLYGPGLAASGIDTGRFLVVRAGDDRAVFWAMEQALRCPSVTAVVGEIDHIDLFASRRLQLAAEAGGGTGLILKPRALAQGTDILPSAAVTRWRVEPCLMKPSGPAFRPPIWTLDLWRNRAGTPRRWTVMWNEQTLRFDLVASLADRSLAVRDAS